MVIQLVNEKDSKSLELIKKAINDKDAQVRKAVITNVKNIPSELLPEYEKLLTDSSYETVALALEKLSIQFPENARYLEKTKGIEGTRGRNVIVKWLEIRLNNIFFHPSEEVVKAQADALNQIVLFTSGSYEFMTRQNAFASLKKLDYFNQVALENILDAAFSNNNRLASPAIETLKYFYAKNEYRKMIGDHLASKKWNDWQNEIIKQIQN